MYAKLAARVVALLVTAGVAGTAGCELISEPDRSKIPNAVGTGSTGGGGQGGGQGGQGGQGGEGGTVVPCTTAGECPGDDDECQTRTCEEGTCGFDYAPNGKPVTAQVAQDCKKDVCDGQGNVVSVDDPLDVLPDMQQCSDDVCVNGTPMNPPAAATTPCDEGGGHFCDGSGSCVECLGGGDCFSGVCDQSNCVPATCVDGTTNGYETDLDCGGVDCNPCADLLNCLIGADCQSKICQAGKCKVPSCTDNVENGAETDLDCGGGACPPCLVGEGCAQNSDCLSGLCSGTTCLPSCIDTEQNGSETDVDCGGGTCPGCAPGEMCNIGSDCASLVCNGGLCAAPLCGDGQTNDPSEECDDANASNTDACLVTCQAAACGDGFLWGGVEDCDDANLSNTDACLATCVAATCGDTFVRAGVEACDDGNATAGDGCFNCLIEGCGDGTQTPNELCDDGNLSNDDGCLIDCTPATCGDGFVWVGMEECDDGNGSNNDACRDTCLSAECGDGYLWMGVETCDDANFANNDGCSTGCGLESGYTCNGVPAVCSSFVEINCADTLDNDVDATTDCSDTDCELACNPVVGPCAAGQVQVVYAASGLPIAIPDNGEASGNVAIGNIQVGGVGVVQRVVMQLDITHTYDLDLDISLRSPTGTITDVSSDNGSSLDNYTKTIFNTNCVPLVTSGTAPFTGCYKPEQAFTVYNGTPAKGTWSLIVADDLGSDVGTLNEFKLTLCVSPSTCGDGVVNAGEGCDDLNSTPNDGCTGSCALEPGFTCSGTPTVCAPICGDGLIVGGETCDDGDATGGDGCSATCSVEVGSFCYGAPSTCIAGEVEPNNTFADADARALDAIPVLFTGDARLGGAIPVASDKDVFRLELAADSVVHFEVFDQTGVNCTGVTPSLKIYNQSAVQLYLDTISGIGNCPMITANLATGTYYVQVEENGNNAVIPGYQLEVNVIASAGSEVEPNEVSGQSTPFLGNGVFMLGGHQVNTDSDYYMITIPAGPVSLFAEIIEGGTETCESGGIASRLTLYDVVGTLLVDDTIDARGSCSKIDGTGQTTPAPADANAHNLPAGTYFLQVRASSSAQTGVNGQFDYRLVLIMR